MLTLISLSFPTASVSPLLRYLPPAHFVFSISEGKMGLCSAAVVLNINCFERNVDDFPEDVLFEKCCLSLKDSHSSWQQEDAVAGSTCQWPGPLAVAELWKETVILYSQSWPCPEIWGDVSYLSLLQSVQLPCNRTQWDSSSFLWSHNAGAIQVTCYQPHRCSSDMGTWDPPCLNPLTRPLPYFR